MASEFEDDDFQEHFKAIAYTNMPGDSGVPIGYGKTSKNNPDCINVRLLSLPLPNIKGQVWFSLQLYDPMAEKPPHE